MSVKINEKQNPRNAVTSKQKVPEPSVTGLSPDDPIDVKVGPGQPPQPQDPPPQPK